VIGIDFGTSNSVMAYIKDGMPTIIPNAKGKLLTPSLIGFDKDGRIYVGEEAKAAKLKTISSFKRKIGTSTVYSVYGREYTPTMLSFFILHKLKHDAEQFLEKVVNETVITVPAYFTDKARQEIESAAEIAGLRVLRIINEPTAAILAYGFEQKENEFVMVWDLGGGTFDVSIMEFADGIYEVKSTSGNVQLGGNDWTDAIYDENILGKIPKISHVDDFGIDPAIFKTLEFAKIELTTKELAVICLNEREIIIRRSQFEMFTRNLCDQMVQCVERALQDAGTEPKDLDKIILVGGATRMPMIQKLVVELTGRQPYVDIDPDVTVAMGAAIQGGILSGALKKSLLVDVVPLSLGIETEGGVFTRVIPRNSKIPVSKDQIFITAIDNQREVDIHVLQGEQGLAKDNISLRRFTLSGIPEMERGVAKINVTFSIDINGILHVAAKDIYSENEIAIAVRSNRLSAGDIEKLIEQADSISQ